MTKPGLGRLFVAEQLQRYFVAAIGFAVAALWSFAGSASGLTCLLVAGVCYGVTAIFQRGLLGRIVETAKQEHTRLRSSPSAARAR
jgi:drug/metabolite transporter (DMT)-like permease